LTKNLLFHSCTFAGKTKALKTHTFLIFAATRFSLDKTTRFTYLISELSKRKWTSRGHSTSFVRIFHLQKKIVDFDRRNEFWLHDAHDLLELRGCILSAGMQQHTLHKHRPKDIKKNASKFRTCGV
jgi:hypothetical protein